MNSSLGLPDILDTETQFRSKKELIERFIADHFTKTFMVYLISHSRPIAELLALNRKNITDWALLDLQDIETLPAVRWKLINLGRMSENKHQTTLEKLNGIFDGIRILSHLKSIKNHQVMLSRYNGVRIGVF